MRLKLAAVAVATALGGALIGAPAQAAPAPTTTTAPAGLMRWTSS